MKRLMILAIPLVMTGCGIPAPVTVASYAFDGALWVASGKTVKDYALSAVLDQDCAMFRLIEGEPICTEFQPNAAAAEAMALAPPSEEMLLATQDGRVVRVAADPASATDAPLVAETKLPAADEEMRGVEAAGADPAAEDRPLAPPSPAPTAATLAENGTVSMSRELLEDQSAYDETVVPVRQSRGGIRLH